MNNNISLAGLPFRSILRDKLFRIAVFIVGLVIAGEIIIPGFASARHVMIIVQTAFFLGLLSLSQTIVMVAGKSGIDLSVGGVLTIGVITGAAVLDKFSGNLFAAFIAVVAVGFILGMINGLCVSYLDISPLVMTMAMGSVLMGLALLVTEGVPGGLATEELKSLSQGHLKIGNKGFCIPYVIIIWAVLVVVFIIFKTKTRTGYNFYSIGVNERAAHLQGVRFKRVRMFAYAVSGMFASVSGLLMLGYAGVPNLTLGEKHVLNSVAAVVIGGVAVEGGHGTYSGAVLGAILIIIISSILSTLNLGEGYRNLITGIVILVILFSYRRRELK